MLDINAITLAASKVSYSEGMTFLSWLYKIFGICMKYLLQVLDNKYFIAIIIFTVVTRVILFPINVRQQRTTAKQARLQPKIQKIQKKYPDPKDRMKMNEEIQDLYAREGHNQMQMGCGPMLFQMVFLMGIIGIIYYPLTYILGMDLKSIKDSLVTVLTDAGFTSRYLQLGLIADWDKYGPIVIEKFPEIFNSSAVTSIEHFKEGMQLWGFDMTQIPPKSIHGGTILLVPVVALLTSLASSVVSTLIQKKNNPAAASQMGNMMLMMLMMPFMSFFIAFQVPAAVGFYWIISNLVAIVQQLVIAKFFPPRKSQAKLMVENTIERRAREKSIKNMKK